MCRMVAYWRLQAKEKSNSAQKWAAVTCEKFWDLTENILVIWKGGH